MAGMLDAAMKMSKNFLNADSDTAKGIKANADNVKQYNDAVSGTPVAPKAPPASQDYDKVNKTSRYGNRPGEKRPGPDGMPTYHKGVTSVPKTGPAIVKKGEAIIPAEHNPMNPENMFDKVAGMAKPPAKEIDHLKIRKAKTGGHIVEHHHTAPGTHKMEEHLAPTMKALHDHIDSHYGSPNVGMNDGNSPADPTAAMSEAVGGA